MRTQIRLSRNFFGPFELESRNQQAVSDSPTILVADDSADTRLILRRSLEFDGFRCVTANDGFEVLEKIHEHNPSLIYLDLMLPQLNGFQVLLRMQNQLVKGNRPKVCVISAHNKSHFVEKAYEFGADDFLVKPIKPVVLSAITKRMLNKDKKLPVGFS